MGDWQLDIFECVASLTGKVEDMRVRKLAGWVKEPFAIDPRRYWLDAYCEDFDRGWVITHLPTGHIVRGVKAGLSEAKDIADALLAAADWNFTDTSVAKGLKQAVEGVMERYACCTAPTDFLTPLWLDLE